MVLPDRFKALPLPTVLPLPPLPPAGPVSWVLAPPWQCESAKPPPAAETPQRSTGALTGAETVLPETAEALPLPTVLPLPPPAPPPGGEATLPAPPAQPEFEKPSTASERPHRLTGALIGSETEFPDSSEPLPLPRVLPLPPPEAWATPTPGSANMAATIAAPAVADTHLSFFI